jgi:hypothetical protein
MAFGAVGPVSTVSLRRRDGSMTSTTLSPVCDNTTQFDEPHVAHIVSADDQMRGYVMGEEIVALCGERFIPTRDPHRYPVCKACRELIAL